MNTKAKIQLQKKKSHLKEKKTLLINDGTYAAVGLQPEVNRRGRGTKCYSFVSESLAEFGDVLQPKDRVL